MGLRTELAVAKAVDKGTSTRSVHEDRDCEE
jgi:hypothetical protein